ncbi:MAG: hypothetical protein K2L42_02675 [Clostridia bacterium]|nr:hypothetical protein [Clostridia bacterium]
MQLLIILALLLYGGKGNAQNLISEVKPVLETFGGEEIKEALKSAEEISQMLSAVKELAGGFPQPDNAANDVNSGYFSHSEGVNAQTQQQNPAISFPLAPISNVANRDITYSLSKYLSAEN